jgi:hypothetical protein
MRKVSLIFTQKTGYKTSIWNGWTPSYLVPKNMKLSSTRPKFQRKHNLFFLQLFNNKFAVHICSPKMCPSQAILCSSLTLVPLHCKPFEFVTMLQYMYWKSLICCFTKKITVKCILLILSWFSLIAFLMPTNLQVWVYIFNEPKNIMIWLIDCNVVSFLWERSHMIRPIWRKGLGPS